jgi:hypothetical protein
VFIYFRNYFVDLIISNVQLAFVDCFLKFRCGNKTRSVYIH